MVGPLDPPKEGAELEEGRVLRSSDLFMLLPRDGLGCGGRDVQKLVPHSLFQELVLSAEEVECEGQEHQGQGADGEHEDPLSESLFGRHSSVPIGKKGKLS